MSMSETLLEPDHAVHGYQGDMRESSGLEDRGCWRVFPSEADCLLDNGSASGVTSLKACDVEGFVGRIGDCQLLGTRSALAIAKSS